MLDLLNGFNLSVYMGTFCFGQNNSAHIEVNLSRKLETRDEDQLMSANTNNIFRSYELCS